MTEQREKVAGPDLDRAGIDAAFVVRAAGQLLDAVNRDALHAGLASLRNELERRMNLAWQIEFGEIGPGQREDFDAHLAAVWSELACMVACSILHDQLDPEEDTGSQADRPAVTVLNVTEVLVGVGLGAPGGGILDAGETRQCAEGSLLPHALELFASYAVTKLAAGVDRVWYPHARTAIARYVETLGDDMRSERWKIHFLLAALYDLARTPAETPKLGTLVAGLGGLNGSHDFGSDDAQLARTLAHLPTVRNLGMHLVAGGKPAGSYDAVSEILDEIESRCGDCLSPDGCQDQAGGCAARADDDAPYCTVLIDTYLRFMEHLWSTVLNPAPLDHAILVAEGRSRRGSRRLADRLLSLRCNRFAAYRRQDDREYLRTVFDREEYAGLPNRISSWLLTKIPVTPDASDSPTVDVRATFTELGLEPTTVLNAIFRTLDDPNEPIPASTRVPLWMELADSCADFGFLAAEADALEGHREDCETLYSMSKSPERAATAVDARAKAAGRHAAVLAAAGRFDQAVERLEADRITDLRLYLTFHGMRTVDTEAGTTVAQDLVALRDVLGQVDTAEEGERGSEDRDPSAADLVTLRRRADSLGQLVAARTTMDLNQEAPSIETLRGRAEGVECPIAYLWSSSRGAHLLCVPQQEPVRYAEFGENLSSTSLEILLAEARAREATGDNRAQNWERLLATCLDRGLGETLAQAAPEGRCILVPFGAWRSVPVHLAAHISAETTPQDAAIPVISYAITGSTTASRPSPGTYRDRPAVIMTDLASGSTPAPWIADYVNAECRMVTTLLGPQATVLSGPAAGGLTLAGFLRAYPQCAVVHLSIHGSETGQDTPGRSGSDAATPDAEQPGPGPRKGNGS